MDYKIYQGKDHYYDPYSIRKTVFMDEQGFTSEEDEIDNYATHVVIYDKNQPVATGRVFRDKDDHVHIGRICVLKPYRAQHLGRSLMELLEEIGFNWDNTIYLSAQVQAIPFYEKLGYTAYGEIYMDEHCPHKDMKKSNSL